MRDWTPHDPAIRAACTAPGGLLKLAKDLGIAYSTMTKRARQIGARTLQKKRPQKAKFTDPSNAKKAFNTRPRSSKAPDGPVVVPEGIKVQVGACHKWDDRYQIDPESSPFGAGFSAEWKQLRGGRK